MLEKPWKVTAISPSNPSSSTELSQHKKKRTAVVLDPLRCMKLVILCHRPLSPFLQLAGDNTAVFHGDANSRHYGALKPGQEKWVVLTCIDNNLVLSHLWSALLYKYSYTTVSQQPTAKLHIHLSKHLLENPLTWNYTNKVCINTSPHWVITWMAKRK